MSLRLTRHAVLALCASLLAAPVMAQATGALSGRVVDDRTNQPVAGVEVSIPVIARTVMTDSSGVFAMRELAPMRYEVLLRKIGFQPTSATITVTATDGTEQVLRLVPAATELSKVLVVSSAANRRLASFEEHRRSAMGGSFLTAEDLEKEKGRALVDVLQRVGGADIVRIGSGSAYFATRRGYDSFMNMPSVSAGDRMRGAPPGLCYAAVVLNNVFVYRGQNGDELFDLNTLAPTDILAIEIYKGGATMPLEYNTTRKTCGLLVIFTK
jgi:Carboxypeptidase regulatory-like domain/TonB-dependent Receptor Plug Domain